MGIKKIIAVAALVAGGMGAQAGIHSLIPTRMHLAELAPCTNCGSAAWADGGTAQLTPSFTGNSQRNLSS